jgi:hypothetical protein
MCRADLGPKISASVNWITNALHKPCEGYLTKGSREVVQGARGAIMPTDIGLALIRKAEAETQAFKEELTFLFVSFLWAAFGTVLAVLIFERGFDPTISEAMATIG